VDDKITTALVVVVDGATTVGKLDEALAETGAVEDTTEPDEALDVVEGGAALELVLIGTR
jgi:hypothetical protein